MQNNIKSSAVAGVLGVFLGAFGAHDWYLGNVKKAITHVCLCVGGIIMLMVGVILMSVLRDIPALNALSFCVLIAAYVIIVGNGIWGFIEGVVILAQGDAGLAAKGYRVSAPITMNETMPVPDPNTNVDANMDVTLTSDNVQTINNAGVVPVDAAVPTESATTPDIASVEPTNAPAASTLTEPVAPAATNVTSESTPPVMNDTVANTEPVVPAAENVSMPAVENDTNMVANSNVEPASPKVSNPTAETTTPTPSA